MSRIEELTKMLEQITPGKWAVLADEFGREEVSADAGLHGVQPICKMCRVFTHPNAEFIAAAPEAVRDLLEVVKAARSLDVTLARIWNHSDQTAEEWRGNVIEAQSALRRALEAFNDQEAIRVKALDWYKWSSFTEYADTVFGRYQVHRDKERFKTYVGLLTLSSHDTLEDAKAACQTDFQRRITECLERESDEVVFDDGFNPFMDGYDVDPDGPQNQVPPFRASDIERGLILLRTSSNAHGYTNCVVLTDRIEKLPAKGRQELARMMRNIATEIDGPSPLQVHYDKLVAAARAYIEDRRASPDEAFDLFEKTFRSVVDEGE